METIEQTLARWRTYLCPKIELASLIERNPTAHKWKAGYRSMVLRETLLWRMHDLLEQIVLLSKNDHSLGARILLRSSVETMALLVYANQRMQAVLEGKDNYFAYLDVNAKLLLGSKDKSTPHPAVNILTVLERCNQRYDGILAFYTMLCEAAHPNFDGVCAGYSKVDHKNFVTNFANSWKSRWGTPQDEMVRMCLDLFEHEYNIVWRDLFEKLEAWLEDNDTELEAEHQKLKVENAAGPVP